MIVELRLELLIAYESLFYNILASRIMILSNPSLPNPVTLFGYIEDSGEALS